MAPRFQVERQVERSSGAGVTPRSVGDGIVFVLARWSPDALMRWDELLELLDGAAFAGRVVLLEEGAADFDRDAFAAHFALPLQGWGETFLVRGGRVVAACSAEEGCTLAQLAARARRAELGGE
jgi:hypothetical protein